MEENKSAQSSKITTQHIPPIEIFSGSVMLETKENVGNAINGNAEYPKRHVFSESRRIRFVRVIMFNGSRTSVIEADYTQGNPSSSKGSVEIWFTRHITDKANMVFRTGNSGKLQVEIDNVSHVFGDSECAGTPTHRRMRRTYNDLNALPQWVRLKKPDGTCQESTDRIVLIQIWAEAPPFE